MATVNPGNKRYKGWNKQRRFDAAVRAVVHDNMSQVMAAREFGISRTSLNPKCREYRIVYEQRLADEAGRLTAGLSPFGLNENRRMPGTFQEWDDYYFAGWQCPDCGTHHERKPFHDNMLQAVMGPDPRVVVNLPPFHSKSTYVTVKSVIHQLCENPNSRQIIISKSQGFSETFLESISQLLTNDELYHPDRNLIKDFGPFRSDDSQQVWNRRQIYIAGRVTAEKDPTIQCLGVGNQIYGRRADRIILDDVADTDNQRSPDQVAKMLNWLDKMVHTRVGKSGKVAYVGTRVDAGDIYGILKKRTGWKVITYPCVLDDVTEEVLWPEHFPYSQAMLFRNDMTSADFQLIYQNVDVPGLGASFSQEAIDECKDMTRKVGDFDDKWRLVAGLDPAGGNKRSGFTAFTLLGIDLRTGNRFLVDQVAVKSMRAPQLKDQIFDWTERYPIYEWRVESNGLQSNLVQYNEEIIKHLARKGVRVMPHHTNTMGSTGKWDDQFGVEALDVAEPMLTPSGWTTMGEIQPGDEVFAPDGSSTKVAGVSATTWREAFRVTFGDGSSLVTDADHRWFTSGRHFRPQWLTTKELMKVPGRRVPLPDPLYFPETDLPIHPYVLGAWLGDGTSAEGSFTQDWHNGDLEWLEAEIEMAGYETVRRVSVPGRFRAVGLRTELRLAGLLNNKHIPMDYLLASEKQRLLLLQGLMDTDGTVVSGRACFTNTNFALTDGVAFLLSSLGIRHTTSVFQPKKGKPERRVQFRWHTDDPCVFAMPRKVERAQVRKNDRMRHITVRSVESVGFRWVKCLMVEHASHQFVAGKDLIVTGNSTAPLFNAGMISIPWGNAPSAQTFQPFVEELIAFPMGAVSDRVMSFWFADLGCRQFLERAHLPLFNDRMRVPSRIRRNRHLVDFYNQTVDKVPMEDQRRGAMVGNRPGGGRVGAGRPKGLEAFEETPGEDRVRYANLPGFVSPGSMVQTWGR